MKNNIAALLKYVNIFFVNNNNEIWTVFEVEGSCLVTFFFFFFFAGLEKDDSSIDGAISEGAQQGAAFDICIETTVPKQGQNLW